MSEQRDRSPFAAKLDEVVLDIFEKDIKRVDVAASSAATTMTVMVIGASTKARLCQRRTDMFIATRVFRDAVEDKRRSMRLRCLPCASQLGDVATARDLLNLR